MSQSEASGGPTIQQTEGGVAKNAFCATVTYESKAVGLALPITATVVTLFRLVERLRQRRVWFDDGWAAFAMVLNIIFSVANWLYLHNYGNVASLSPSERMLLTG